MGREGGMAAAYFVSHVIPVTRDLNFVVDQARSSPKSQLTRCLFP